MILLALIKMYINNTGNYVLILVIWGKFGRKQVKNFYTSNRFSWTAIASSIFAQRWHLPNDNLVEIKSEIKYLAPFKKQDYPSYSITLGKYGREQFATKGLCQSNI